MYVWLYEDVGAEKIFEVVFFEYLGSPKQPKGGSMVLQTERTIQTLMIINRGEVNTMLYFIESTDNYDEFR